MPRPLFTANRQSANTLIWRRFDPFRPYRLLAWLIAAPLGYSYSVALLQPLFRDSAWFAWYPLMYTLALALIFHKSLIRLLWNPPILVCDEHGLTAFDEYGRWLGQWQWAQIAELRVVQQADDNLALEVIMHGERPQPPAPPAAAQRTLASYGTTYLPAADSPAEAPRELLPLPELGPDLLLVPGEIRRHRARATLDSPRSETRAWYKHPRAIQLDNWRCFTWLAATLVSVPLLLGIATRSGFNDQPAALYLLTCASLLLQQSWRAFRRLIADPARPVARIDGEGIRIDDGATCAASKTTTASSFSPTTATATTAPCAPPATTTAASTPSSPPAEPCATANRYRTTPRCRHRDAARLPGCCSPTASSCPPALPCCTCRALPAKQDLPCSRSSP